MTFYLTRIEFLSEGIFGSLLKEDGKEFRCVTLEHAYETDGVFLPKIPKGSYQCVRGRHQLRVSGPVIETFEITGVKGHTGLLFHTGNVNEESEGCVLLGAKIAGSKNAVFHSRVAFQAFMNSVVGINEFTLVVN